MIKELAYRNNVSLVCLQETKLSFIDRAMVAQCCGNDFSEFAYLPAEGSRGGVLLAWKGNHYSLPGVTILTQAVAVTGCNTKGEQFGIIGVYGLQGWDEKMQFLHELRQTMQNSITAGVALALVGDFNLITRAADKNNSRINRRCITAFRSFINELQLKDLYLHGRRYTWSNEQD